MSDQPREGKTTLQRWLALGPAIITASVVLGPGSILLNSKVGAEFGTQFVWLLAIAVLLMMGATALSARLGVALEQSVCTELSQRYHRGFAVLVGLVLFVVTASFQSSNNLGLLFGIQPLVENFALPAGWELIVVLVVNLLAIAALVSFREVYKFVERFMKFMVVIMLVGFAANLWFAGPSLTSVARGLLPQLPSNLSSAQVLTITGLVATTFSIGAAFYQAYLVKQKNWGRAELKTGLLDTLIGIGALGLMSLMIMLTAASLLHESQPTIKDAADLARQLQPLFGDFATLLLCVGILAGALSSFLVNALLGGTVMSDALGKDADVNSWWVRGLTIAVLGFGMLTALAVKTLNIDTASLIVFAQAVTILGNPILAASMLLLAQSKDVREQKIIPGWMLISGWCGMIVITLLSVRTAFALLSA